MAKRTSRVVLNRKAIDGIELAAADGVFAVGKAFIAATRVPDAPPYSAGLVDAGGVIAYAGKKKIDGTTVGGRQIKKPRAVRLEDGLIQAIAGWPFPARLVQFGHKGKDAAPHPFAFLSTIEGRAKGIFDQAAAYRIARIRS